MLICSKKHYITLIEISDNNNCAPCLKCCNIGVNAFKSMNKNYNKGEGGGMALTFNHYVQKLVNQINLQHKSDIHHNWIQMIKCPTIFRRLDCVQDRPLGYL